MIWVNCLVRSQAVTLCCTPTTLVYYICILFVLLLSPSVTLLEKRLMFVNVSQPCWTCLSILANRVVCVLVLVVTGLVLLSKAYLAVAYRGQLRCEIRNAHWTHAREVFIEPPIAFWKKIGRTVSDWKKLFYTWFLSKYKFQYFCTS